MVTIIGDSLDDYGIDEVGGRCHDLLGTRCDPYGEHAHSDRSAPELGREKGEISNQIKC